MNEEIRKLQNEEENINKEETPIFCKIFKRFKVIIILLIAVVLFFPYTKIEKDFSSHYEERAILCYNPITKTGFVVRAVKDDRENDSSDEMKDRYLIDRVAKGFATVYITENNTENNNEKERWISLGGLSFNENEKEEDEFTAWEIYKQVFFYGGVGRHIKTKG